MMNRPTSRDGLVREKQGVYGEAGDMNYYNQFEKDTRQVASPQTPTSRGVDPSKWPLPPAPLSAEGRRCTANFSHKRAKSSYSLFPTRAEDIPRLPATIYAPPSAAPAMLQPKSFSDKRQTSSSAVSTNAPSVTDVHEASLQWLNLPPPLFSQRHRRDDSNDSSATVQIGLRFSVAPAAIAAADCITATRTPQVPGILRRNESNDSSDDSSLGLPIQQVSSSSENYNSNDSSSTDLPRQTTTTPPPPPQAPEPAVLSPSTFSQVTPQNSGSYLQAARNKVLPPTPRRSVVPPLLQPMGLSGLRMNPVSPAKTSPSSKSPTQSPTGKGIGLGAGTMARSPPAEGGWI
jgi:hypothetical protein